MASARLNLIPLLFAPALLTAAPVAAQGQASELHGRVVSASGAPITGATITLIAVRYSLRSDSLGQFRFSGPPGSTLALSLQANGFRDDTASVVLRRGRPVVRDFVLVAEETPVPEANSSGRVVRGQVTTTDGEPISYANVQINGGRRFVADDSGRFAIPLTVSGRFSLLVRRIGFEPGEVTLDAMPDSAMQVHLNAVARALPEQQVLGKSPFVRLDLGGFYRRMAEVQTGARVGYFVTPEDLALRNPLNVTDAVEQFPNIKLGVIDDGKIDPRDGMYHPDAVGVARKYRIEDRSGCPLTVYLDRMRIQPSIIRSRPADEDINSLVQPTSVAGMEVYLRALDTPPEYPAWDRTCGVVLIWTK